MSVKKKLEEIVKTEDEVMEEEFIDEVEFEGEGNSVDDLSKIVENIEDILDKLADVVATLSEALDRLDTSVSGLKEENEEMKEELKSLKKLVKKALGDVPEEDMVSEEENKSEDEEDEDGEENEEQGGCGTVKSEGDVAKSKKVVEEVETPSVPMSRAGGDVKKGDDLISRILNLEEDVNVVEIIKSKKF